MSLLTELKLQTTNPGACLHPDTWLKSSSNDVIDSINPTTGEVIAQVTQNTREDYEQVIQAAQTAFKQWQTVPAPKRGEIIRQIGEQLRQQKSALGSLVSLETGKSKQEGDGEVQEMIDMADLAVGMSRQLYGKTMHSERHQHRMYEHWHPLGVVGVITAFNFPVAVWAWNAFVAAICGNTVVWKGSPLSPLCTLAVQHICNAVLDKNNLPAIFSCWTTNNNELVNYMVKDPRIALLSFTGSSAVGRQVAQTVAARMGKYLLECSGNNAIIVEPDANLELVIPAVAFGATGTAGQRCTTTRRLFLHNDIADQVTQSLIQAYGCIRIGDPLDENNLMGPLITDHACQQYKEAIEQAKAQGGSILFGGNRLDRPGFFVEPTLIEAQNHWDIVQQETFAPILYIMRYAHLEEAIEQQNAVCQGLSSALFSQDLGTCERFLAANGSDCGIANINIGTSGAEIGGAFGGEKATGGGREAGSDSWKAYMRRQTTTINWSPELPLAQGICFNLN